MKTIHRDYTLTIIVPDDVAPDDCEIVVDEWSASYIKGGVSVKVEEKDTQLYAEEPYEMEG